MDKFFRAGWESIVHLTADVAERKPDEPPSQEVLRSCDLGLRWPIDAYLGKPLVISQTCPNLRLPNWCFARVPLLDIGVHNTSMAEEKLKRCRKCQGSLRVETGIDLVTGVVILQYVCFNCGRRWHPEKEPRPLTAA